MLELTDKQIAEYFKRSYTAIDGLWFMKTEEIYGFDTALDIDGAVWQIVPKIQARKLKEIGNLTDGLECLRQALVTKLSLDGFDFKAGQISRDGSLKITINECPWHNTMIQSGRKQLSGRVGTRICTHEYQIWAHEFGNDIQFELGEQICEGAACCSLLFYGTATVFD